MTIEGELVVRLEWDGSRVRGVAIRSTRPFAAPSVLEGRAPSDAAAIVPRLFSVCANAQRAAAEGALRAASGEPGTASGPGMTRAVVAEAVQESVRRLLIDLPPLCGVEPAIVPVAAARRALAPWIGMAGDDGGAHARIAEIVADAVLGMPIEAWLAQSHVDDVRAWARRRQTIPARMVDAWLAADASLGAGDVPPMPAADHASIETTVLARLRGDPRFAAAPDWNGAPVETGSWPRALAHPLVAACTKAFGNGVATRTIARLTCIAQDTAALGAGSGGAVDAWSPAEGEGASFVHTARGVLVHAARVERGRVARYAIVAPTEWNFHPRGALACGLAGLRDADADSLKRRAAQVVHALDPCVACAVEAGHA